MIEKYRVCNCGAGEFVFHGEMIQPAEPDVGIFSDIYQFTLWIDGSCGCLHELSPRGIDKLENEFADDYALDH